VEENLASCLGDLVTAKVKEALADEPGEIFCDILLLLIV